jgi:hypothetical protein
MEKIGHEFEERMDEVGMAALELVADFFTKDEDSPKVEKAFKFLPHAIKVRHMRQTRQLQERSQAIRLLNFLPDEETRQRYIKATQPGAAPLLEHRPIKK